ncbi:hypothetical protein GGS23DRAFT_548742 [Durotheca rogersii]|uniref:uncharacterized protein n=1 Tax=Durotheca rogersii TaxID=419775 RepID=UPI00221EF32C|nr:uncharacterized protein GGS23DRAFT_548742 [Durotheca rogersii]KAI5867525.1 hypothetical protein GGS23DRAFT_548742 [Durotheca rogersii]
MSQADLSFLSPAEQANILDQPSIPPPPGVESNLDNPPNGDTLTRVVVGVALAICLVLVLFRLADLWTNSRKFGLNDFLLMISFASYVAYSYFVLDSTNKVGYLLHQWDVSARDMMYLSRNFIIGSDLFALSTLTIKLAIILEWLRIFNPTGARNKFYWITLGVLSLHLVFHITALVVYNVSCQPYEKNWNPFIPGSCFDNRSIYVISTVVFLVIDVCILLLPQRAIWGLQMPTRKKLGVASMFMVGVLAIASVVARLVLSVQLYTSTDLLYTFSSLGILVVAEMVCGIIILCALSVPKMFGLLRLRIIGLWSNHRGSSRQDRVQAGKRTGAGYDNPYFRYYNQDIEPLGSYRLHTLESARSVDYDSPSNPGSQSHSHDDNLVTQRTTDFTAVSVQGNDHPAIDTAQLNHKHPTNSRLVS